MYAHQYRLDTPPPSSQFRRPWSPVEQIPRSEIRQQMRVREASEVSFEALDLADYATTLQRTNHSMMREPGPYPMYIDVDGFPEYPGTPPRSFSLASRGTFASVPSLSSGPTSVASHTISSAARTPSRRPFSLPPTVPRTPTDLSYTYSPRMPRIFDPNHVPTYNNSPLLAPDYPPDVYDLEKQTAATQLWDPSARPFEMEYPNFPSRPYSTSNDSHRVLVPWAGDEESRTHISSELKEERMRMLEKEFSAPTAKGNAHYGEGHKLVGSIDAKGHIITPGPKKRAIVRWAQFILALGAMIASVYSALILKPPGNPPPRGRIPAYLLYILSTLTVVYILYMFLFRAYCCTGTRKDGPSFEGPGGVMVLPVQGLPGSKPKKGKKDKKGKKGKGDNEGVQVNLIVDPSVFGGRRRNQDEESEEETEASGGRRRGLFEGLAMEEKWKMARKRAKTRFFFDMLLFFLWGAEFTAILLGKRCPVGQFDGWCDGYNVATAFACLLTFAYGFSIFFGIKDLHSSRVSPRSRT
ncbi:hypothetical protein SCHPADRAFT_844953 [Schizopora paradoxa]|uniref:MARVEL domain-containing protein n=1 Tax=Schizopora paradoxa TaxID=27342 RepID=A0A0H2S2T6_9AGAM|nr:hypothetical protein SCHPADRAFT_844953 [Schizopora paradoxa]